MKLGWYLNRNVKKNISYKRFILRSFCRWIKVCTVIYIYCTSCVINWSSVSMEVVDTPRMRSSSIPSKLLHHFYIIFVMIRINSTITIIERETVTPHVRLLVGRSVCHNFFKGREVTLHNCNNYCYFNYYCLYDYYLNIFIK